MSRMRRLALLLPLGLGACAVVPPAGPSLVALPPKGKELATFQNEDASCRNYANGQIGFGTPQEAANQAAVGSAVVGTALGAAAGALIGSAGGAAGAGAAVGAGTGLLVGSAIGGNNAQASSRSLQQRYDAAYAQCMTSNGNELVAEPSPPAYYGGPYAYPYPYPYYYPGPAVSFGFYSRPYWRHYGYRRW